MVAQRNGRYGVRLAALAAVLVLAGCVEQGVFPGGPPPVPAFDGVYSGTGQIRVNGNFACPPTFPVSRLTIAGGIARFGPYRGTAGADGTLRMVARGIWITGRIDGTRFTGQVTQDADNLFPMKHETCIYDLTLNRAGG